jgi:diguanylate cyclase (GGDEF)-like protein
VTDRVQEERPTIGLLVDWLEDRYQNTVISGVMDAALEHDVNLICFAGGGLDSPLHFGKQRNRIFDLVGPKCVDALLLMSGTLANYIGPAAMARYCKRFSPLPTCSIAVALEGIPSILVDNATGMRQAVVHLITVHGCRRIAFIRGPEVNEEAELRFRVYCDVLREYGLPLKKEFVVSGDFQRSAGVEAVSVLFDSSREKPDAVVAADDYMALGVMDSLPARGLRVPEDVAVVGFDDVEEARFAEPPLTTVHQPLYEKGRFAMETILAMLRNERVAERLVMHTDLVTRTSCGCEKPASVPPGSGGEREIREQAQQRLHVERWARTISQTEQKLITNFDVVSMVNAVAEQFPRLGIASCYLSLYRENNQSELILAYDIHRDSSPQTSGELFPSNQLVPKRWMPRDKRFCMVVEPLFFEDRQFGFALFDMGSTDGIVYEMLRDQISAAMKGASLVREVLDKDTERKGLLSYIIDVTPDMHRIQPLEDLFQGILKHATGLAGTDDAFLAAPPEGEEGNVNLVVRAACGRFFDSGRRIEDCLNASEVREVTSALQHGRILVQPDFMIIPLRIRELVVGVVYLHRPAVSLEETELLRIFSNQATIAIQNTKLYEMAALDPLTGVHTRRFFEQWMQRQLRSVFLSRQPISMLMIDLDGLKIINDTSGHLVGDKALATVGKVVRRVIRDTDVVGRYGGDEFAVLLPHTTSSGAALVGARIVELLDHQSIRTKSGTILLRSSVGVSMMTPHAFAPMDLPESIPSNYFVRMAQDLILHADTALYQAKREGGQNVREGEVTRWRKVDSLDFEPDTQS